MSDVVTLREHHSYGHPDHHWVARWENYIGVAESKVGAVFHLTLKAGDALPDTVIIVEVDSE